MILLKTDGFLMEKVHTYDADASEKYVCPNYAFGMSLRQHNIAAID